jgi:hypothetical protein
VRQAQAALTAVVAMLKIVDLLEVSSTVQGDISQPQMRGKRYFLPFSTYRALLLTCILSL